MKQYIYKIQWLIHRDQVLKGVGFKHLINILGAKSLTKIVFRTEDLKIVDSYNGFIMYGYGLAEFETLKYVKKLLKKNAKILYVELVR